MLTTTLAVAAMAWLGPRPVPLGRAGGAESMRRRAGALAMQDTSFDYLVIGGGSGGIASARRAAAHGARVAVIERGRLGGTCVNVGCVPKKVMFNAASVLEMIHQSAGYGFSVDGCSFDLGELKKRRDAYVARLNGIYQNNLGNSGVEFITGDAKFVGPKSVDVGGTTYTGSNILVAVGGKRTPPPVSGVELAIDSDGFFDLEKVPKRTCVVGSGYIAVELAGILNVLGSEVQLAENRRAPARPVRPSRSAPLPRRWICSSAASVRCARWTRTWWTSSSTR